MELSPSQKQKIKKLLDFADNNNRAIFDELQQVNETLKAIASKPDIEIPGPIEPKDVTFPDIQKVEVTNPVVIPDFPQTDLTKTNTLLQKLIDKEDRPVDINVNLEIT